MYIFADLGFTSWLQILVLHVAQTNPSTHRCVASLWRWTLNSSYERTNLRKGRSQLVTFSTTR
jgi:hypothetical protein